MARQSTKISCLYHITIFVTIISQSTSTIELDGNDLDDITKDAKLHETYLNCMKGAGRCTEDGRKLREAFLDALKTNSIRIDEVKLAAKKIVDFIIDAIPDNIGQITKNIISDRMRPSLGIVSRHPFIRAQVDGRRPMSSLPIVYQSISSQYR